MGRRHFAVLLGVASCGGGDEEACRNADRIKAEILEQRQLDGFQDEPCSLSPATRDALGAKAADYDNACALFEEEQQKCEG